MRKLIFAAACAIAMPTSAGATIVVTETFQSHPLGSVGSQHTFANFTFSTEPSNGTVTQGILCGSESDRCLTGQNISGLRTFNGFAPNVVGFGFEFFRLRASDRIAVTLTTGDGILNFDFFGSDGTYNYFDYSGILSMTFENLASPNGSSGNYSFDNVSVYFDDVTAPVPEPATWALMLAGFGAIGFSMRRRNHGRAKALLA